MILYQYLCLKEKKIYECVNDKYEVQQSGSGSINSIHFLQGNAFVMISTFKYRHVVSSEVGKQWYILWLKPYVRIMTDLKKK